MIYLGADHGGFALKEKIKDWLSEWNFQFKDLGNTIFNPDDDYPDFAMPVAEKVNQVSGDLGILVCRSGQGMDVVANKFPGIRSVLCFSVPHARQSRQHLDANVLCLASDYVSEVEVKEIIHAFLTTEFSSEERHQRRLAKIQKLEEKNFK